MKQFWRTIAANWYAFFSEKVGYALKLIQELPVPLLESTRPYRPTSSPGPPWSRYVLLCHLV